MVLAGNEANRLSLVSHTINHTMKLCNLFLCNEYFYFFFFSLKDTIQIQNKINH